jgi:hypothetical protein
VADGGEASPDATDEGAAMPDPVDDPETTDDEEATGPYERRAFALRERAREARASFTAPSNPPDRDRAVAFARDGVGAAAATYVEARTEDSWVYFTEEAFDALDEALNVYLELFAACHRDDWNPDIDGRPGVTVRTAAETLLDTHDAVDTAGVLIGVHEDVREDVGGA